MSFYTIDEYGRAVVDSQGLFELWYRGGDTGVVIAADDDILRYNEECARHDKLEFLINTEPPSPISHSQRVQNWLIPDEYKNLDVDQYVISLCSDDEEVERVKKEMVLYHDHNLVPVLRALIYMVKTFREKKIVWGVGRGSSVASFVLFLIGIHKINSIKFDLDIRDFLR